MFLLGSYSSQLLTFSPTSCSLLSHLIFDKAIPLIINKPRTAIPRFIIYNSKAIKHIDNLHKFELAEDISDDVLDVISNFHLCHYNICLTLYLILFIYIGMRYIHFDQLHKRNT